MNTARIGLPGFPSAVTIASFINVPPMVSQAPGSSATRSGVPTIPKAPLALDAHHPQHGLACRVPNPDPVAGVHEGIAALRLKGRTHEAKARPRLLKAGRAQNILATRYMKRDRLG